MADAGQDQIQTSGGTTASERTPLMGDGGETSATAAAPLLGWSSLSPRLRRAVLVCLALALSLLVLLLIIAIILLARGNSRGNGGPQACALSKTLPELGEPQIVWGPAANMTAVARVAGYVHVYEQGFYALDVDSMSVTDREDVDSLGWLSLAGPCARIKLNYSSLGAKSLFYNLQLSYGTGQLEQSALVDGASNCTDYSPRLLHEWPVTTRYACRDRQVILCLNPGSEGQLRPTAELVLTSFEVELYETPQGPVAHAEFRKPPYYRSCIE